MARRRYVSTTISRDKQVNRLAMEHGDFAALLYTWMIPHADDDGCVNGDAEELLMEVVPGRRDKSAADITTALEAMESLRLIEWDRVGTRVVFPYESFYRHQSYIREDRRRTPPSSAAPEPAAQTAADQRTSPQISADQRTSPHDSAKRHLVKASPSFKLQENEDPKGSGASAPTADPPPDELTGPTNADGPTYALVDAFAVATKRRPAQLRGRERKETADVFRPIAADATPRDVAGCAAYLRSDSFWDEPGKLTARKVAQTIPEWIAAGRPESTLPRGSPNGPAPALNAADYTGDSYLTKRGHGR